MERLGEVKKKWQDEDHVQEQSASFIVKDLPPLLILHVTHQVGKSGNFIEIL